MARRATYNNDMIECAQQIVKDPETARQLRTSLKVLIPKVCRVSNSDTAQVLGVGVATAVRMQKKIAIKLRVNQPSKAVGA